MRHALRLLFRRVNNRVHTKTQRKHMVTFKQFLIESARRDKIRMLFEDWNPDYDDKDTNEFGEKWEKVDKNDFFYHTVQRIARECQIDPDDDSAKVDRIYVWDVHKVKDGPYIINFGGGANGGGDEKKWVQYFALVKKVVTKIQKEFKHVWMLDWTNDCLDDVWTLRICVDPSEPETTLHEDKRAYMQKNAREHDLGRVISKFWVIRHRLKAPQNDIDFWIKKPFKALQQFVDSFDERN